jgi:UDP-3-O-[3-hydroxymyristoyl] N-acetylglucosamine deacetylase
VIVSRKTIGRDVVFAGLGLHSGEPVTATVRPGSEGIWFTSGKEKVQALPENVTDTTRSTRLGSISTIEHLMSALAALEVTDAEIEVVGGELPAAEGCALPFFRGLSDVGSEILGPYEMPNLFTRIFHQEDSGLKVAVSKGNGHWRYLYDLGARWPGEQAFELPALPAGYAEEVAGARTLVLTEEIARAKELGLGKGLDESSVLIVGDAGYVNKAHFPDEPARHKLLDLIGDLYLAGIPVRYLNVVAEKSGHRANVQVAAMLYQAVQN